MYSQMSMKNIDKYLEYVDTFGIVPGLYNMNCLVNELNNPLDGIKVIHIAGTNGKGSVSTMIAQILTNSGTKVGIYNSPALVNPWEIIRFGNIRKASECNSSLISITKEEYYRCLGMVIDKAKELNEHRIYPTRFEIETAAAFVSFRDNGCEFAIVETGMGGLEDATNVIDNPIVTVLTSISMDHMSYLGDTIEKIIKCKCGIFKENSAAVVSNSNIENKDIINKMAKERGISIVYSDKDKLNIKHTSINSIEFSYKDLDNLVINTGALCQLDNAMTAIDVINVLKEQEYINVDKEDIKGGLNSFIWQGRFQIVKKEPLVIADGAHNPAAAKLLRDTLINAGLKGKVILLMAVYKDKDYDAILQIMSEVSEYIICTDVGNSRAFSASELALVAGKYFKQVECKDNFKDAMVLGEETATQTNKGLLCFGTLSMMKYFV